MVLAGGAVETRETLNANSKKGKQAALTGHGTKLLLETICDFLSNTGKSAQPPKYPPVVRAI